MKKYLLLLTLIMSFSGHLIIDPTASTLNNQVWQLSAAYECPKISIECPTDLDSLDDPYSITVMVEEAGKDQKLTYHWTISDGEIIAGQGTNIVTVKLPDLRKKSFLATVEIGGLPQGCDNKVSCSLSV